MKKTIGFIGCGNMGAALARAVAKSVAGENILLADLDAEKCRALADELGARVSSAEEIAKNAYAVVLGVKPQALEKTLAPLKEILKGREAPFFFISMAAGTSMLWGQMAAHWPQPMQAVNLLSSGMASYCMDTLMLG